MVATKIEVVELVDMVEPWVEAEVKVNIEELGFIVLHELLETGAVYYGEDFERFKDVRASAPPRSVIGRTSRDRSYGSLSPRRC